MTGARVVMEVGPRSPWLSRMLSELGHDVIVATPGRVRLIARSHARPTAPMPSTSHGSADSTRRSSSPSGTEAPWRRRTSGSAADTACSPGTALTMTAEREARPGPSGRSSPASAGTGRRLWRWSGARPDGGRAAVRRRFGGAPPGPARAPGARRGESPAQTCPGSCGPACAGTQRRRFTTQLVAIDVEGDRMRRRDYGSGGLRKRGNSWQATLWLPRDPETPIRRGARARRHRSHQEGGIGTAKRIPASARAWPRCGGCRVTARRVLPTLAP